MNRLTIGLGSLLVFQALLVVALWLVDPFQSVGQREFGAVLGAELGLVAIFLHLYLSGGSEYDQEWVAVGLAFVALIGLLVYFVLKG